MNPEELIAELYKAGDRYGSPSSLYEERLRIAHKYLMEAYYKGRREAIELSDQLGYERNVKRFVDKVMEQNEGKEKA